MGTRGECGVDVAAASRALAVAALLTAGSAFAEQRFDHRGSVGLLLGGGIEFKEGAAAGTERDSGLRYLGDLGGTFAVDYDGNELMALVRGSFGRPQIGSALILGYRGYFGADRAKTFFDLGGALHFTPAFTAGARLGFGFQYELSSVIGVYVGAAAQLGGGNGIRFSAEVISGLQFRSYLLE